jgi:hypothetical protein
MSPIDLKTPVRIGQCRLALGQLGTRISPCHMSAIVRAMHPDLEPGRRINWIAPAAVQKFLRDHPTFRQSDVYARKKKPQPNAA